MAQYKMIVDLTKCVGCGNCGIACKIGNNTPGRQNNQSFNWKDYLTETKGYFPNTSWQALPVNCNHCDDPACVKVCPSPSVVDTTCDGGTRKGMYKLSADNGGMVLHDDDLCIGCQNCQSACPYSTPNIGGLKAQFSVISYNISGVAPFDKLINVDEFVPDGTGNELDLRANVSQSDVATGYRNKWTCATGTLDLPDAGTTNEVVINDLRRDGIVEKCTMCAHRVFDTTLGATENAGERRPYCVIACPAGAIELSTAAAPVGAKVLAHQKFTHLKRIVLLDPLTTGISRPNVYYTGSFSKR